MNLREVKDFLNIDFEERDELLLSLLRGCVSRAKMLTGREDLPDGLKILVLRDIERAYKGEEPLPASEFSSYNLNIVF